MEILKISGLIGKPQGFDELLTDYYDETRLQSELEGHSDKTLKLQINSGGGYTSTGFAMYDLLKTSNKEIEVDVLRICGSIATVLLLAGAKGKRRAHQNSEIFIHFPYWSPPSQTQVTREDAQRIDKDLAVDEERIMSIYLANTKADRSTLTRLMKAQTALTPQEALDYGFIDEIIPHSVDPKAEKRYAVMAFLDTNKQNNMQTDFTPAQKSWIEQKFNALSEKFGKMFTPVFKLMMMDLQNGSKIFIETEDANNLKGMKCFTVDETGNKTNTPAPDGEYTFKDGRVATVTGGVIADVKEAATPDVTALKKENDELKAKLEAAEKQALKVTEEKTAMETSITAMKKEVDEFKNMILGGQIPGKDGQDFKGGEPNVKKSQAQMLKEYREKNKK